MKFLLILIIALVALVPVKAERTFQSDPLLDSTDLIYLGKFCGPATGGTNPNTTQDGGNALAYDETEDELILMGNWRFGNAMRMTVPTPSLTTCPRATQVGGWLDMQWRFPKQDSSTDEWNIGGFYPLPNGDMVISAYDWYDGSGSQRNSHILRQADGTILPGVDNSNWTKVGNSQTGGVSHQAGFVSGWIVPIPSNWQAALGGNTIVGNGSLSIVSRTSHGPAAFAIDISDIDGVNTQIAATPLVGYDNNHQTLGDCEGNNPHPNDYWDCASSNQQAGFVWPEGTATLLYWHRKCPGAPSYSGSWHCGVSRVTRVLAYDANDLVDVKNGLMEIWEVEPYAEWDLGTGLGNNTPRGLTYDTTRGYIYVTQLGGDSGRPSIHAWEVDITSGGGGGGTIRRSLKIKISKLLDLLSFKRPALM